MSDHFNIENSASKAEKLSKQYDYSYIATTAASWYAYLGGSYTVEVIDERAAAVII